MGGRDKVDMTILSFVFDGISGYFVSVCLRDVFTEFSFLAPKLRSCDDSFGLFFRLPFLNKKIFELMLTQKEK